MIRNMNPRHTLLLIALACLPCAASATIYKWVDKDGNVQFSQNPPPQGVSAEKLETPKPATDAPPPLSPVEQARQKVQEDKQREQEAQADAAAERAAKNAAEDAAEAKQLKESCARAREKLTVNQRPRVTQINEDGTETRLPEEERLRILQDLQEYLRKNCA